MQTQYAVSSNVPRLSMRVVNAGLKVGVFVVLLKFAMKALVAMLLASGGASANSKLAYSSVSI